MRTLPVRISLLLALAWISSTVMAQPPAGADRTIDAAERKAVIDGVLEKVEANYVFPDVGVNFALLAYVAVALGGFGSILGSLAAGVLIGLVESLGGLFIDLSYKTLLVFGLYLAVVLIRPQGLFGRF